MLRWFAALDSIATRSTVTPAMIITTKLRSRLTTGLRRLLRGTAHATFTACSAACPRPSTPYRAASTPTTTADVLPCKPFGAPSWLPTIGNWRSADVNTSWRSSGSPCRMKPSTEDAISSSGKIAMKA